MPVSTFVHLDTRNGKKLTDARRTLATSPYLVTHVPAPAKPQHSSSKAPTTTILPPTAHTDCTSHFLHPLSWMRPELEQGLLSGRLECPNPKCGANVGRYAWQGMKCSCGIWVCPAFSLQKARIDGVAKAVDSKQGQGEIVGPSGMRLPPGTKVQGNL